MVFNFVSAIFQPFQETFKNILLFNNIMITFQYDKYLRSRWHRMELTWWAVVTLSVTEADSRVITSAIMLRGRYIVLREKPLLRSNSKLAKVNNF